MKEEECLGWNLFPKVGTDTTYDMRYKYEQTVIKRVVKHLMNEIILKAFINRTRSSLLILKINYSTTVYLILFKVM
jgi:hypothetical protein